MLPDWLPERIKKRITVVDRQIANVVGPCWEANGWANGGDKNHKKARWHGVCTYVHRITYALHHKKDERQLGVIDHLCRNECCCNPDHLEDVTMRENTDRGQGKANQYKTAQEYASAVSDWREPLDAAYG